MADNEETQTEPEETSVLNTEETPSSGVIKKKKLGKWFRKVPKKILFSPGGMVLMFFAIAIEIIDLIPGGGTDTLTWELFLEAIFCIFLAIIAKIPFQTMIIPLIIERIPGLSDFLPTWLLKMFF